MTDRSSTSPWGVFLSSLILGAVFLGECWMTWRKWPDLVVDFGRNLYIPWRMNQGEVLYRDLDAIFGPLSHHIDALLFRLFDTSFLTLVVANLFGIVVLSGAIYYFFHKYLGIWAANLTTLSFLTSFAFGQYLWTGNYNYVTPYSQESVHGIILLVLLVCVASNALQGGRWWSALFMGGLYGLACMTRLEMFVTGTLVVACHLLLAATESSCRSLPWATRLFSILGGFTLSVLGFHSLTGQFPLSYLWFDFNRLLWAGRIDQNPFYANMIGTDHLADHVWLMGQNLFWIVAMISTTLLFSRYGLASAGQRRHFSIIFVWSPLVPAGMWIWNAPIMDYLTQSLRALPVLVLVMGLAFWYVRRRSGTSGHILQSHSAPLLLWAMFSFGMLLKILFNTKISHYGFVHAMPASLLLVGFLTAWLPKQVGNHGIDPTRFRMIMTLLIALALARNAYLSQTLYGMKNFSVGEGKDRIVYYAPQLDSRGAVIRYFLSWMEKHASPDATFVVIPEGVMLNYLSRHATTTPSMSFLPLELRRIPEEKQIDHFERRPPDYVVVVFRPLVEYGYKTLFGEDASQPGAKMVRWIHGRYHPVSTMQPKVRGADSPGPLATDPFWIQILAKNQP
ncbi:MAG: hypothetical protein HQL63_04375 [Magnetococcales bacterium]|nr:hypothetical protein [Magnetococcales bacterium]MBF0321748.1 hypothetical protein [Magnetococcales bacterium]